MKSMLKSELARMAGVSRNTFSRWLSTRSEALSRLGYSKRMRLLPPHIVRYILHEYGIVDDDDNDIDCS